jgi:hypothetical protein
LGALGVSDIRFSADSSSSITTRSVRIRRRTTSGAMAARIAVAMSSTTASVRATLGIPVSTRLARQGATGNSPATVEVPPGADTRDPAHVPNIVRVLVGLRTDVARSPEAANHSSLV